MNFMQLWADSAITTIGLFWMAFSAFCFGYFTSSMIQILITKDRMQKVMGEKGLKDISLGTFFGFISSSCSFAALSTTRTLFSKGSSLVASLAFLLASTNLVIELGIVIAVFLSWQFVVGEYLGGILLILMTWLIVTITSPKELIEAARKKALKGSGVSKEQKTDWKQVLSTKKGWKTIFIKYLGEWRMVWKDVTIGFTLAGIIANFLPDSFFQALFMTSDVSQPGFFTLLFHTIVGPIAAFFTFIGSMGNIPLAAVLYSHGVSFAGIIAFIFSDLVVLPVLRIQAQYYGWKMSFYIMATFLISIIVTALTLHYGLELLDLLPSPKSTKLIHDRNFFEINANLFFNIAFALLTFLALYATNSKIKIKNILKEKDILGRLAVLSFSWLIIGAAYHLFTI